MKRLSLRPVARLLRWSRDDRGQSAVEFAFMVPLIVFLLIGIVEFSKLWMQFQVITDASREAARAVVIADDLTAAQKDSVVKVIVQDAVDVAGIELGSYSYVAACDDAFYSSQDWSTVGVCGTGTWDVQRGTPSDVGIRVPYFFDYLRTFFPGQPKIMLKTRTTMRHE